MDAKMLSSGPLKEKVKPASKTSDEMEAKQNETKQACFIHFLDYEIVQNCTRE